MSRDYEPGALTTIGAVGGFFLGGGTAGAQLGAILGSSFGASQAAGKAAEAQAEAAQAAIWAQRHQFNVTRRDLRPFREAGVLALGQQQSLLGMGTPEEQQQAFAAFTDSPGQQFLRNQQERALLRNSSAIGGLGGGNVRTALQEQAFGRAQTDFGNQFNRLASLSGTGQTAATSLGQFGSQSAGNIANLQAAGGEARASGILGQQQARAGAVQDLFEWAAQHGYITPTDPPSPEQFKT